MLPRSIPVLMALSLVACGGGSPIAPTPPPALPQPVYPTADPRFDVAFYRQLAHNTFDAPSQPERLRRLTASPSIYLQRTGLSDAFVAQLEQAARETIPALTGGALSMATWATGDAARAEADGWIVVELRADESASCGYSLIGQPRGHVWLNTIERCRRNGEPIGTVTVFTHELGHALGFWHVDSGLMQSPVISGAVVTDRERYHGAVAYQQPVGTIAP